MFLYRPTYWSKACFFYVNLRSWLRQYQKQLFILLKQFYYGANTGTIIRLSLLKTQFSPCLFYRLEFFSFLLFKFDTFILTQSKQAGYLIKVFSMLQKNIILVNFNDQKAATEKKIWIKIGSWLVFLEPDFYSNPALPNLTL